MTRLLGIGVIGLGGAGGRHARALQSGRVEGAKLVAASDPSADKRSAFGTLASESSGQWLGRADVDGVVVATPHPTHVALACSALRAGHHVLVEKPLGINKAECEAALAVWAELGAQRPLFGVVHDYRADPRFVWLRERLLSGELGRVERVVWQATDWFRSEAYYRASPWRGKFSSEGGGVLVNQAPHLLDTLLWLFGRPRRVWGRCQFGRFHDIEVEDDVTAQLEFASGTSALVVVGTGEAPGTNRLEISADRGRIVIDGGAALVHRNREPASVHRRRDNCARPLADVERVELGMRTPTGLSLLKNFVGAMRGQASLLAPAEEALHAVELANAILLSSLLDRSIELPLDSAEFARAFADLTRASRLRANSG
ncbi:MAG TPA: Gfo/Idh/MocA family oxidoreductase [Polyangiaceae bacterium]|nr:Gfo/Idh/MocA family oxidoreductase [Polyangiaceae bacterium]